MLRSAAHHQRAPFHPALASTAGTLCCAAQVNTVIDEVAQYAESNARLMAAVRAHNLSKIPAEERKRVQDMYHNIAVSCVGTARVSGLCWTR
jgi:hypothetical protein